MGSAMLDGWRADTQLDADFTVIEPFDATCKALAKAGIAAYPDARAMRDNHADTHASDKPFDMVVLAVKPQMMAETLDAFKAEAAGCVGPQTAYLSIAAGITGGVLMAHLGAEAHWLRAMPNTPAAIGQGITALYAPPQVPAASRDLASQLLLAIGQVEMLDDEAHMDSVTALSGSGPAYVFYLAEVMAAAGVRLGLDPELSMRLGRQTVAGAGALMASNEIAASTLRENVTSKGGTTAAALSVLMRDEGGLGDLLDEAMRAAHARSIELASK